LTITHIALLHMHESGIYTVPYSPLSCGSQLSFGKRISKYCGKTIGLLSLIIENCPAFVVVSFDV
jgi:hypothetical protein